MIEHSEGPWRVDGERNDPARSAIIRDATGFAVADARHWLNKTHDDNARLIAASPQLLEALKQALHHIRSIPADYDRVATPKAFAISAIAEGLRAVGITNLAEID